MTNPTTTQLVEPDVAGRFSGLKVVVTGAGSGIGLAAALRIAREGGHVIATDIDAARLQALTAAHPALRIMTVAGDLTDPAHQADIVAACGDRLDGLVNNAGINDGFVPMDKVSDALWDQVMAVNLTAPFKLTRALFPLLQASSQASIVNVGSVAGLRGSGSGTAYTTSKHALVGLTRSIAFLYDGIRCNLVAPAGVVTNIDAKPHPEHGSQRLLTTMPKFAPPTAQPEQIAATILFLLSRDSSNINGTIMACDGGMTAI